MPCGPPRIDIRDSLTAAKISVSRAEEVKRALIFKRRPAKIPEHNQSPSMALYQRAPFATANKQQIEDDVSDQEQEALVNDYKQQVQFDDGIDDLGEGISMGGQMQDMQAQLAAAATPLEYQATLETKVASYDNYCSLFHYVLNSEGPVDLEVPSVSLHLHFFLRTHADIRNSTTGPGM